MTRSIGWIAAIAAILTLTAGPARALDTIYLVRHAEKVAGWPDGPGLDPLHPLSAVGMDRADQIAARLAEAPLVAVYATPTTRTLHTALVSADVHGLAPIPQPRLAVREQIEGWIEEVRARFDGEGAVLVVGHSNTIPWFFEAVGADATCFDRLGVTEEPYGLATAFYDGLWEIDLGASGCGSITRHTLGE